jgi:hypothetical protein
MNSLFNNDRQDDDNDNHFFDVQALNSEDLDAISGGANCSYSGGYDYNLGICYETRNYSC